MMVLEAGSPWEIQTALPSAGTAPDHFWWSWLFSAFIAKLEIGKAESCGDKARAIPRAWCCTAVNWKLCTGNSAKYIEIFQREIKEKKKKNTMELSLAKHTHSLCAYTHERCVHACVFIYKCLQSHSSEQREALY